MIGKRSAYSLLAGLVLFNASISIASGMGFVGPVSGTENIGILSMYIDGLTNVSFWATVTGIAATFAAMSKGFNIHITFSSVLFSAIFVATSSPLHSILKDMQSAGWLSTPIYSFITMIYSLAFIIGLMELSR